MFNKKKKENDNINYGKLNEVIDISRQILKIVFVLIIVLALYIGIIVCKELHIKSIILSILNILSPLFIGIFVAWLFDPFVTYLKKKGLKRSIGTIIVYVLFLGIIGIIIGAIIPILYEQINDFVKVIPETYEWLKSSIENIANGFKGVEGLDADNIKLELLGNLETFASNLTSSLPTMLVNGIKNLFSGMGTLIIGLIIGFYLLLVFDNANDLLMSLVPERLKKDTKDLVTEVNTTFRHFIDGAIADCTLIFIVTSIAFWIIGLKAPLLFGLFCGITNVIPYAGPYIGGAPAVIVGFSMGPITGILTLVSIFIIQFFEGNFLQPLIMSKSTKIHPVTIILGLLLFGHFFGIIGMVISTPLIGAFKAIFKYFNDKFNFFSFE